MKQHKAVQSMGSETDQYPASVQSKTKPCCNAVERDFKSSRQSPVTTSSGTYTELVKAFMIT